MVKVWKVKPCKVLELQSDWRNGWSAVFGIRFERRTGDHAGWLFSFELFELWYLGIHYYDTRHEEHINDECEDS